MERREVHWAGRIAIKWASYLSWWEWTKGSTINFWRWPAHYQKVARIGVPPMFDVEPPRVKDQQPPYANMEERDLVKAKLEKVLD